jgi:hypothetical protein
VGLEPTHPCGYQILSLARLPFRHAGLSEARKVGTVGALGKSHRGKVRLVPAEEVFQLRAAVFHTLAETMEEIAHSTEGLAGP